MHSCAGGQQPCVVGEAGQHTPPAILQQPQDDWLINMGQHVALPSGAQAVSTPAGQDPGASSEGCSRGVTACPNKERSSKVDDEIMLLCAQHRSKGEQHVHLFS